MSSLGTSKTEKPTKNTRVFIGITDTVPIFVDMQDLCNNIKFIRYTGIRTNIPVRRVKTLKHIRKEN